MNPLPFAWLIKWMVIVSLGIVLVGMIPLVIADQFGPVGLVVFAAAVIAAAWFYIKRRLPTRKRAV